MFTPRLDALPPAQKRLWSELSDLPEDFALYGGTAIALRLGHRVSVDIDFFSFEPFAAAALRRAMACLDGSELIHEALNTLTVNVERGGLVKVSFFGKFRIGQVQPHEAAAGSPIKAASLIDLAGMKAAVVTQRAETKDYLDIHAPLAQAKIPLAEMLAAAAVIYESEFNPLISLKAVSHHEDESLADLPLPIRRDLVAAVRAVETDRLPVLPAFRRRVARL